MRARRGGAAVALAVAVGLLVPAGSAAAETFSFGPGSVIFARARATHGYRINFSENDKGYFFVRVKGHGATTDFAMHTTRAPVDRLVADFGRRGKFDLRFVPVGRPESIPINEACRGKAGSWQIGYLVGQARFRTERGYTRLHIRRVRAAAESWSHQTCEFGQASPPGHPKEKHVSLTAVAAVVPPGTDPTRPKRTLSFGATQFYRHARRADRRVTFVAELKERAGRISIHRKVVVTADQRLLSFPGLPQMPEEMEAMPPAPFTGSARLLRTPESTFTWTGDLAVTFPGLDPIRLTGPRFGVVVCAKKGCVVRPAEQDTSGP